MNQEPIEIIRLIQNSDNSKIVNGFFDDKSILNIQKFFSSYLKMEEFKNNNPSNLIPYGVNLSESLYKNEIASTTSKMKKNYKTLAPINDIEELDFSYRINDGNNFVFGLFPNFDNIRTIKEFNMQNKGKIYKGLVPRGENEYALADITLGMEKNLKTNQNMVVVKDIKINKDSILTPTSKTRLKSNGKIAERIYTINNKNLVSIANADYYEFTDRLLRYNTGVALGSKTINEDLLSITSNAVNQTSSYNKVIDIFTAWKVQDSLGIKSNSYRNTSSEYGYLSGNALGDLLNNNSIDKDNFYKIQFAKDSSDSILDIEAYSSSGELIKDFKKSDIYKEMFSKENQAFFKRDRVVEKIGYADSRFRQQLTDYEITKYNKKLEEMFSKGEITYQEANQFAREIITEQQVKTLNAYGFDNIMPNLTGSEYVDAFNKYYNVLSETGETTNSLTELYNFVNYNIDSGFLTGNIKEGKRFDNNIMVGKQSANTAGKTMPFSQAIFNPMDYGNVDGQRKAQGGDRLAKLVINNGEEDLDVSTIVRGFFSSTKEMQYKQTHYKYLQGQQLLEKLGEAAGIEKNNLPKLGQSTIKVLYTDTPLAFQDSNVFTNSAAMQIPSMKDNKTPFHISYSSLNRNVFGDASDVEIKEFFNSLKENNYNFSKVKTSSGIENTFLKNLLGEENYNKFLLGGSSSLKEDLMNIGNPLKNIGMIENNEINYIKASSEATEKFNSWVNKYFIKSNGESIISILNENAVNNGTRTTISGSNFAFIEGINFNSKGIDLNLKHTIIQGHGSKLIADQLKGTTQLLTNVLGLKLDSGAKVFFEGIVNEKPTKGSRGFTGTFFARSLATMAYNSIYGDLASGEDIINGQIDYQKRFDNFKRIMSGTGIHTPKGTTNIFDLFNIDMRYENGDIILDDKNVGKALSLFDESVYESLNGRIITSMQENLKKIFGRDVVGDEGRILGAYAQELMFDNYDKVLATMKKDAADRSVIRIKGGTLFKDYVAGNNVGLTNIERVGDSYLFISDIAGMMESKKRKTEEGLKLGRLSAMVLSEAGFENIVKYMENKSLTEHIDDVKDYLSLAAPKGTEFARSTENYIRSFNKTINIENDTNIYNPLGTNLDVDSYLRKSPIGRLMDFDNVNERLNTKTKGIIEGFSTTYMNELKDFFNINKQDKYFGTLGKLSQISIINSDLDLRKNHVKELGAKVEDIQTIRLKLKEYLKNSNINIREAISGVKELEQGADDISPAYEKFRIKIYDDFINNTSLTKTQKEILENIKNNSNIKSGLEFYKTFVSLGNIQSEAVEGSIDPILNINVDKKLYNFNLNRNQLNDLSKFYFTALEKEDTKILESLFSNYDNIQGQNIYNIIDLQQISHFGNIPFIIDSLAKDENGKIVPNKTLSVYERIIKTGAEIKELEHQQNIFSQFTKEEWESLLEEKAINDIDINLFEKANSKIKKAADNFLSKIDNPEDLEKAKSYINSVYKNLKISDLDLNRVDDNAFYKLFKINDEKDIVTRKLGDEIHRKLVEFQESLKELKTSNSNVKKMLDNFGIDGNVSNIQQDILNKSIKTYKTKKYFDKTAFDDSVNMYKNILKGENSGENVYDDVIELERQVKKIVANEYRNIISKSQQNISDFISFLNNETSIEELAKITENLSGIKQGYEENYMYPELVNTILRERSSFISNTEKELNRKKQTLTSLLLGRNNHLADNLFQKGGALYEMSSTPIRTSSAISPREASAITTFIKNEMLDVYKGRKFKKGKVLETKAYNDLKTALSLTYGDTVIEDVWKQYKDAYFNSKLTDGTINEIKNKLDSFSHVVVGTKKDFELIGRQDLFKNGKNVYYGFLSRHPHQYKYSLSPMRIVQLSDEDMSLSFWGKYLGTGSKVETTQSNLMFIGKATALAAKGDFDGDVFQIMSLGQRMDMKRVNGMDVREFAREFDIKSKLFYMLDNIAGENLKDQFSGVTLSSNRNKRLKQLIERVYFNGKNITNAEAYSAIENQYLSMSHEKSRIMKTLSEEKKEHANIPKVLGSYGTENNKISKKAVSSFLMTIDDKARSRYLFGQYDEINLRKMIEENVNLSPEDKEELIASFRKDNGQTLLKAMQEVKDDDNNLLFAALYNSKNKYLEYTGISKTSEVHTKLSNFREIVSTLMRPEEMEKILSYSSESLNEDFYNSDTFRKATFGHTIGELIEKLAISSKKGNVSPDVTLKSFMNAEKIINKANLNLSYNLKYIGEVNSLLEQEALEIASGKMLQNSQFEEFMNMNFDDWFRSLYAGNYSADEFEELKKSFLTITKGYNSNQIEKLLSQGATFSDVMGTAKDLSREDLISMLSNWSTIMIKGTIQKDLGIEELNTNVYSKIFGGIGQRNFYKRNRDLLEIIKNAPKSIGTRFNSLLFTKMSLSNDTKTAQEIYDEKIAEVGVETPIESNTPKINPSVKNEVLDVIEKENNTVVPDEPVESISNSVEKTVDNSNQTVEEVINTVEDTTTPKIEDITNEAVEEISKLKDDISKISKESESLKTDKETLNRIIEAKQNEINELKERVEFLKKEATKAQKEADTISKIKNRYKDVKTFTQNTAKNVSNSDLANKAKAQISKHKTKVVAGVGVAVLASFFRIFQKSRPVVNLDINEQEYERSQGSIYRNLGQYTINTNIRELY